MFTLFVMGWLIALVWMVSFFVTGLRDASGAPPSRTSWRSDWEKSARRFGRGRCKICSRSTLAMFAYCTDCYFRYKK